MRFEKGATRTSLTYEARNISRKKFSTIRAPRVLCERFF